MPALSSPPSQAPLIVVELPCLPESSYTFFYEPNEETGRVVMPCPNEMRRSILLLCQHFLASVDLYGLWQPIDQQADRLLRFMPQADASRCWVTSLVAFRYIRNVVEAFSMQARFATVAESGGLEIAPHEQWALREAVTSWRDVLYPSFAKDNAYPFGDGVLESFAPAIELIQSWCWIDPLKGYLRIGPLTLTETTENPVAEK